MRSVIFLLFAFIGLSVAFPNVMLEARKGGEKNGTAKGMEMGKGKGKGNNTKNSVDKMCKTMAKLTHLTAFANNQTKIDALTAKGKLNATSVTALKAKASEAATKLATMTSNSTLVSECAVVDAHWKTMAECRSMKKLAKLAALANNQTALDAKVSKKKLNDTQVTKFKAMLAKAQTKLTAMQSNTTLTDICSKETSQKGSSSSGSTTQAGTSGSSSKSGAASLTLQSMPYIFVPALGAIITLFL